MTPSDRLFDRLSKTRKSLASGLLGVFTAKREFDESIYEELEERLLLADLGIHTSGRILSELRERAGRASIRTREELLEQLKQILTAILDVGEGAPQPGRARPRVTLMVGVNGVGKTTTLAKIARLYQRAGDTVMLAACDTFRAAAVEQLQSWGRRLELPVIAQAQGADAAAVAFDAWQAAVARNVDHLLIDTAGRQHTHDDLMAQLGKIKRVLAKADPDLPDETWITLDAGNGQNALSQVERFAEATPLTGICVTKLDGTARGGVVISLADRFGLPIRFIGLGEDVDDLRPFDPAAYVAALVGDAG